MPLIELTQEQRQELAAPEPEVIDPETRETYVLVRREVFDRIKNMIYDDSPWTEEEKELLAWEAGVAAGWEEMDEYDHYEKKP